jgi:hypothetical protein
VSPYEGALDKAVDVTSSTASEEDERRRGSPTKVPSNESTPTLLSSIPRGWAELPPLYAQSSLYQGEPTPPISISMPPLANESPIPLPSFPGHFPAIALTSPIEEEQWTFSQYLVKVCCQNGYQLLVNTPNDFVKIQEVFGPFMAPTERDNFISCFHAGIHDKTGGLIDLMATILAPFSSERYNYASSELAAHTKELESTVTSEAGEWLDASGVQKFLIERGFCTRKHGRPSSRPRLISSLHVAALVQCEYLETDRLASKH